MPRRGWLGVRIQSVTDEIAESLGLDKPNGALVASVNDGGPAQKAGIQPGDVVLTFDGKDVDRHAPPAAPRRRDADRQDGQGHGLAQAQGRRRSTSRSASSTRASSRPRCRPSQAAAAGRPPATVKTLGLSLADI